MKDYSELKMLAEALIDLNRKNLMDWAAAVEDDRIGKTHTEYALSANPADVLALIAEVEGLRAQHGRDSAELRSLSQARDDARKERDQIKAEVERLNEEYDKAWRHDLNDKNNLQVLAAEVVSLSKDAARYRWLRDNKFDVGSYHPEHDHNHQSWFEHFDDETIDENLLAQSK